MYVVENFVWSAAALLPLFFFRRYLFSAVNVAPKRSGSPKVHLFGAG
jgi:hypothetical protein